MIIGFNTLCFNVLYWKNPFYFCFEKVKSNRTKATCPKFLIFKMYEEKVSEPKLNAD